MLTSGDIKFMLEVQQKSYQDFTEYRLNDNYPFEANGITQNEVCSLFVIYPKESRHFKKEQVIEVRSADHEEKLVRKMKMKTNYPYCKKKWITKKTIQDAIIFASMASLNNPTRPGK